MTVCPGAGAMSCQSCYHGYRLIGSSICDSQCMIGFYLASQVFIFFRYADLRLRQNTNFISFPVPGAVIGGQRARLPAVRPVLPGLSWRECLELHRVPCLADPERRRPLPELLPRADVARQPAGGLAVLRLPRLVG